jgi:exonuclease SbcC
MRPEKITLKNIGPFLGTHVVDFTELGDIFLVYGKTGAGKTTIFDAMCFALYGNVPGARRGLERQMRSQFAQDGDECAVVLEFALAGRRYRVTRSLAGERLGVRSGKLQSFAEEVTLDEWKSGDWSGASRANKSETDAAILALVGLSAEEFSRIVLLPQGEFARFLRQNSAERKEVLAKLFPVERYGRVIALARERAREAELRQKETEHNILELGKRFNALIYAETRAALSSSIRELREKQTARRGELATLSANLEKSRAAAEKRKRLAEISVRLEELSARADAIEGQRKGLESAIRAAPLMVSLAHLDGLRAQLAMLDTERIAASDAADEARARLAKLETDGTRMAELKTEREALLVRKERLTVAADIAVQLESETETHRDIAERLSAANARITAIKTESAARSARLSEIAAEASAFEDRNKENNRAREDLEKIKQLRVLAEEHEREAKAIQAHEGAVEKARALAAENERDAEIARASLADLEAEANRATESEYAEILARELKDGQPCPVCGSLAHPSPAHPSALGAFSAADRIASEKRRLEQTAARAAEIGRELATREANLKNARDRLAICVERYCAAAGERGQCIAPNAIPSLADASMNLQDAVKRMQEISDALVRSRAAWRETEELRKKESDTAAVSVKLADEIANLRTDETALRTNIAAMTSRYREAFPEITSGEIVPDPSNASDALEECSSRILTIDAEMSTHETSVKEARLRLTALESQIAERETRARDLGAETKKKEETFSAECRMAGFAHADELRASAKTDDERESIGKNIADHEAALANAKARDAQLRSELESDDAPETGDIERKIAELDGAIAAEASALEEKTAELSALDSLKKQWDDLETERAERTIEGGKLAALANDLTGNNPMKVSFDAWILGMYLEEITAYANERLERMSDGRYRIRLNDSYRKGNSLAGLDLEILDAYTGRSRPSGTLSGGETFMASISLALGLADSIQARSGGIQLDAVFIDEGFGSLDETSLERAITILDEIRGSRMVGLVSHVAELRARIPNRIEVVKAGGGSTIRKELCDD